MTEDEQLAIPPAPAARRPLVQWMRTGRTKERATLLAAFGVGLLVGGLLIAGADRRDRLERLWS